MNAPQAACNYAMLRFLPYPETGEFVNVGVLVSCQQPCLLDFRMEQDMPCRVQALFPQQDARRCARGNRSSASVRCGRSLLRIRGKWRANFSAVT